jgi:hypothetical protein
MEVAEIRQTIDRFLKTAKRPVLMEAGEESIALAADNFVLDDRGPALLLQAWDDRRNLVRRITGIDSESRGKLELRIERFGKKPGTLQLVDLARGAKERLELHGTRLEFREKMRRFLRRQFPTHKVVELSTEANLEESLSPAYARALIREGASAWAAIGAGAECLNIDAILSFGLIWLDYLRQRERSLTLHGLVVLLPAGHEKTTCLRLRHMDPKVAQYRAFAYPEDGIECAVDLRDYGNFDTHLEPVRRRVPGPLDAFIAPLLENPSIEGVPLPSGDISFRVHGLEFARTSGDTLLAGFETNRPGQASNMQEIELLAERLVRLRSHDARDRSNPLYLKGRELWLESQVRGNLEEIDARLLAAPVYEQAPTFAAGERGVIDLLAAERDGRLAILELKTDQDIHLPLQALDYWIRVKWHLDRNEFEKAGYFPGLHLRAEPPRMMFVAPALDFHPSNESVLRYFSPGIEIARVGVGAEWQRELKVMFRM